MDTVWFFAIAFAAEIIGTLAGFGSSMILLPVAIVFFDFKTALVLVAFMHLFGNFGRLAFFRHGISWRMLLYFGATGMAFAVLGALLVASLDQAALQALLGVFLIAYGVFTLLKPTFRLQTTGTNLIVGGAASGFLAGLIGTGGALRSAFLTAFGINKQKYIATAAAIGLIVDGTRIPVYIRDGLLKDDFYWMLPILFVLAIAGSYVGRYLVDKIPQRLFRTIVLACLVLAGAKFIFDYVF
jgi:uncharacterized membrane protein YfcA